MEEICKLIKEYREGDINACLIILNRFEPILNKLQKKSNNEDMKSDLTLFMLKLLKKIPLEKDYLKEDKYIISYISKSLNHQYIYLNKKRCNINNREILVDKLFYKEINEECVGSIYFDDIINKLTDNEKYVINKKYKFNYSDTEIANEKGVSRQAIHKIHKKALNKLKLYVD